MSPILRLSCARRNLREHFFQKFLPLLFARKKWQHDDAKKSFFERNATWRAVAPI